MRTTPRWAIDSLADELADSASPRQRTVGGGCARPRGSSPHLRGRQSKAGEAGPPVHDDLLAVVHEKGRVRHDFTATAPCPTDPSSCGPTLPRATRGHRRGSPATPPPQAIPRQPP